MNTDDPRARLKQLRNALAAETPRALARPRIPPELGERLQSALRLISRVYLAAGDTLDEDCGQALVEGQLVLHDWERWQGGQAKPQPHALSPINRREHERFASHAEVRILRHGAPNDLRGEQALESAATLRRARNVSLGGLFVALPARELPEVVVGSIVQLSITPPVETPLVFLLRATVLRRDADGLGVRWLLDSPRTQRSIDALLDATRPAAC
jgi:hypothetical protein